MRDYKRKSNFHKGVIFTQSPGGEWEERPGKDQGKEDYSRERKEHM